MGDQNHPSDEELKARTAALLARAERMAAALAIQNERLAETLDMFRQDIVEPLRHMSAEEMRRHHAEGRND